MYMTEHEICERYKNAAKPREQIRILADMNLCSPGDIRELLERNGVTLHIDARAGRIRTAAKMYAAGCGYQEIAAVMGVSLTTAMTYVARCKRMVG